MMLVLAELTEVYDRGTVRIFQRFHEGWHVGVRAAEAVGDVVETLLQAAGLFDDQGRGLHRMPVSFAVCTHFGICVVFPVDAPHDFIGAKALAVDDQVAGTDLAEVYAAVIRQANLELEAGDFDTIRHLTEKAVRTMLGFRLAHIGINSEDEAEAKQTAQMIQSLFAFQPNENPGSIFMDSYFEIMKTPFLGEKGHIAIATSSVERGKCYLERKGFRFREDSAVFRPDGTMQAVYLEQEVAGFAIHLVRDPQLG